MAIAETFFNFVVCCSEKPTNERKDKVVCGCELLPGRNNSCYRFKRATFGEIYAIDNPIASSELKISREHPFNSVIFYCNSFDLSENLSQNSILTENACVKSYYEITDSTTFCTESRILLAKCRILQYII